MWCSILSPVLVLLSLHVSLSRLQLRQESDRVWPMPTRPRRLMGIFRCYGWGPGCTSVDPSSFRRRQSKSRLSQETETVEKQAVPESKPTSEIGVRQTAPRFHPFFALTSGLCRGPQQLRSSLAYIPFHFLSMFISIQIYLARLMSHVGQWLGF